jgi:glutamine amidotransferase-like uncharacterized protein
MDKDKPKRKFNKSELLKLKILLPLMVVFIALNLILGETFTGGNDTNYKTINVLVYSGSGTSENCVYQTEKIMNQSNSEKLVYGVKFKYNTSSEINNKTLTGYDVVIMPGSSEGYDYIDNSDINVTDLKSFVASGKGFIGICAGAYSAAEYTDNWYYGWGLAPDVENEPYLETGNVTINITSAGDELINNSGNTISHINGPAMSALDSGVITFATYSSDSSYDGYSAIVGDFYGNGRTVLSGVHPELTPKHSMMMIDLILWAYNGTSNNNSTNSST